MLEKRPPHRVPGTAVFLTSDPPTRPGALLHNLKHNKVLHEKNVILTVETAQTAAHRSEAERVQIEQISADLLQVTLKFGFMETPNVPQGAGARAASRASSSTSCRPRSSCRAARSGPPPIPACRSGRTSCSSRSPHRANDATDFFQIPTGRVVEVGTQVTITI